MAMNRIFLYLIISLLTLSGCGQKGDLYLPGDNYTEFSAPHSP